MSAEALRWERFSSGPHDRRAPREGETVLLVADEIEVDAIIAELTRLEQTGAPPTRVIASAAQVAGLRETLPASWQERLIVSDRDLLSLRSLAESSAEREALRARIDAIFPAPPGIRPYEIFMPAAALRHLLGRLATDARGRRFHAIFPRARVHTLGEHPLFPSLVSQRPGHAAAEPSSTPTRRGPQVAARYFGLATVFGAGALASQVSIYARSRSARRAIAAMPVTPAPKVWLGLLPAWSRFNHHIHAAVGKDLEARGIPYGVLLIGDPSFASFDEITLKRAPAETWGGLASCWHPGIPVAQTSVAESLPALASCVAASAVEMSRTTLRVWTERPFGEAWPWHQPAALKELAKLTTVDVARYVATVRATTHLVEKLGLAGSTAVLATSMGDGASLDASLRSAGVASLEYAHGTFAEPLEDCQGACARFIAWTAADADVQGVVAPRVDVAGMPVPVGVGGPRAQDGKRHILMTDNYVHRDGVLNGRHPRESHLVYLLTALDEVAEDPSVEVVWRPHPADDARAVDRLSARFPRLKVSRGGPFVDDLRRADLLVTSPSSVSFEALFADIPVFVHERPDTVDTPATSYYAPARRIVPGEDGVARIREVLAGLAAGRDVLAPERETRRRLFRADDGKPRTVLELLGLTGTPPAPQTA